MSISLQVAATAAAATAAAAIATFLASIWLYNAVCCGHIVWVSIIEQFKISDV